MVGLSLRQTAGLVASLLEMAGPDWPVPDYSTLCRRQARIAVQIPYRRSGTPLNLRIDSTGAKFRGDGEWQVRKHGTREPGAAPDQRYPAQGERIFCDDRRHCGLASSNA
ncbi:transposase, IS4 family protein [Rhodovulum sulfidophilum]|uniref:Transposase, IS4 family protein n=1 Tax=Rhodovulum sulfidophilum TaxID=35806 RepID=A0A0D6B640_RHOSU|nr:transposase, IS4 family protein [Rhodovulum sulfidophilum]